MNDAGLFVTVSYYRKIVVAFNRDGISLLVGLLLVNVSSERYTANSAAFGNAIPNVSCMYLCVASLLKFHSRLFILLTMVAM